MRQPNCIDIVAPLIGELNERGLMDHFQLMGGIGSAVLKHSETVIVPEEQLIVASPDFAADNPDLGVYRDNGTLRDLDALVLSSEPEYVSEVEAVTRKMIDGQLEVSVFGLRPIEHLREQRAHPFGMKSLKTFVSDRYADGQGTVLKGLTPFAVPVPGNALESWTLQVGRNFMPVMNPGASLLNYATRSISGLRPKDESKVGDMTRQVAEKWPGVREWMYDGPGRSQMDLARIFQTLRHGGSGDQEKRTLDVAGVIQVQAGRVQDLREHYAFMYREAPTATQEGALALAAFKSRLLGSAESNKTIVRLFQKFAEKRLDSITKNQ